MDKIKNLSQQLQQQIVRQATELAGAPKVSATEAARRLAICEGCESFDHETRRCKICTCFMDIKTELLELPFALPGASKKIKCADKTNPRW